MYAIALNILLAAQVAPAAPAPGSALRAVDPGWGVIEVEGKEARSDEHTAPIGGSSRALAPLLGSDRSEIVLIRIDGKVDAARAAAFLGRLHQLGARQLALALKGDKREGMLPYCPETDATCIGRPWAGVSPSKKGRPELVITAAGAELKIDGKAAAQLARKAGALDVGPLVAALEGSEATHLALRAQGATWMDIADVIRANPLAGFVLDDGRPRSDLTGALSGFDSLLGGLDLGGLDVGAKKKDERARLSRAVRTAGPAGVAVDVKSGDGPNLDRAGPVKLELSIEDDFSGETLPAAFLQGVAGALKSGAEKIDACYLGAKKKQPDLAGQLALLFRIGKGGKVISAKLTRDRLQSKDVANCVIAIVRSLRFPAPPKGRESVVLSNTFVFK
jgi:hypothetical protein